MRVKDVKVGHEYYAKVSGRIVVVRVLEEMPEVHPFRGRRRHGGFKAENTRTGRVLTLSAARLRYALTPLPPLPIDEQRALELPRPRPTTLHDAVKRVILGQLIESTDVYEEVQELVLDQIGEENASFAEIKAEIERQMDVLRHTVETMPSA